MINKFMGNIREMYGKSWEEKLQFKNVQDQIKYFCKDIHIVIDAVIRCRSVSLW